MLDYLEKLKKSLETLTVSGQHNVAVMFDALRSLDTVIDLLRHPPKAEEITTTQTIEIPVDPRLKGDDEHETDK